MNRRDMRRLLWIGKFAFPKIDTERTQVQVLPQGYFRCSLPVIKPIDLSLTNYPAPDSVGIETETIELSKYVYKGRRWWAVVRLGYSERLDKLIVTDGSFLYMTTEEAYARQYL